MAVLALGLALTLMWGGPLVWARSHEPVPDPRAALERVRVCWEAVDLTCVERELAVARAGLDALGPAEQLEVLRLDAELALSREDREAARQRCVELLELEPRFSPEGWPEAWRAVLEEARRLGPDRLPPSLTVLPPASARPREALQISAKISDPSGAGRVELVLELPDVEPLRLASSTQDGETWSVTVPAERVTVPSLRFRLEAWDRVGNGPSLFPAAGGFYTLEVVAPAPPPKPASEPSITQRWWFWTALGVVVAGGVTALVLALDEDAPASTDRSGDLNVLIDLPLSRSGAGAP